jgi:SAM-dependent methyltransferase
MKEAEAMAPPSGTDLVETNRRFYETLWSESHLVGPDRFNTWPIVQELASVAKRRLELGPGLRPRLPIPGTHFADISATAADRLKERGGLAIVAEATSLPFPDAAFDLVCALDILEHLEDDETALAELSRLLPPGGTLLFSTPLHPSRWTEFDALVGHCRRYEPDRLTAKLATHRLEVASSAVYGMQPRSGFLLDIGVRWLRHRRAKAMWWYNKVLMPIGLLFEKKLTLSPGLIDTQNVDEILLVCKKGTSHTMLR